MLIRNGTRPILFTDGVVRSVDPIGRELHIVVAGVAIVVDVGPECAVTLRGERVKLRMIQPRDRVRVAYTRDRGTIVAASVEA